MVNCGTITVAPAFDPNAVSASCGVGSTQARPGEQVPVPITVTNDNDAPASYSVTVTLNGSAETNLSGTVGGNSQTDDQVDVVFDSPGTFDVELSVDASQA